MDKKRSILNVTIAIATKIILLVFSLFLKKLLIKYVGNDANGVYSLYSSILSFLSIAELGVGTAINFAMYKPIVEGDNEKVSALYNLYKKVYLIIGSIILVVGLALMPALPILAKDYNSSFNLYLTFGIMLFSIVFEYTFSCKSSLINAYKNNYITTLINSICTLIRRLIQLFVLIYAHSFELYLVAKIVGTFIHWMLVEIYVRRHYKDIISVKATIDPETKKSVAKHTGALFMHKIGGVLTNATDSIIISAMIGVAVLGKYSNYQTIVTVMASVLGMFFTPLTSVMGHLCAEGNIEEEKKYFKFMYYLNFTLGIIFYLGYYAVIKDVVGLFFGQDLLMDKSIPMVITINYFVQFIRNSVILFRDATGSFYYDRWKPVIAGTANVILSIILVQFMGAVGVIVATIIINIFVSHVVEPYVLYKHGFNGQNPKEYYIINYSLITVFVGCLFLVDLCMQSNSNMVLELIINGFIAVGIALVPLILLFIFSKTYRTNIIKLFKKAGSLFKKKKVKIIETSNKVEVEQAEQELLENENSVIVNQEMTDMNKQI